MGGRHPSDREKSYGIFRGGGRRGCVFLDEFFVGDGAVIEVEKREWELGGRSIGGRGEGI